MWEFKFVSVCRKLNMWLYVENQIFGHVVEIEFGGMWKSNLMQTCFSYPFLHTPTKFDFSNMPTSSIL